MTKEQSSREVEYKMSLKLLNILLNRNKFSIIISQKTQTIHKLGKMRG